MEGNFSKVRIQAYLGRDFTQDEIEISNAGQPDSVNYISFWKDDLEKPQPTEEQLIAVKTEGDVIASDLQAVATRRKLYGTTAEQLEYIVENGLEAFIAKQNQIKSENPKS
jgi:hypothetical protein